MRSGRTAWVAWLRGINAAGACGFAALVASAALYGVAVQRGYDDVARLRHEVQAAQVRPVAGGGAADSRADEKRRAFEAHFPNAGTLQDWLERIDAAGAASGVTVERTDYRLAAGGAAGLARYHITLPVKGSYPQVRGLIAGLLDSVPALALANVDVKRDAIGSAMVEGRLEFVLFLKAR